MSAKPLAAVLSRDSNRSTYFAITGEANAVADLQKPGGKATL
jgi:hypothetical protein